MTPGAGEVRNCRTNRPPARGPAERGAIDILVNNARVGEYSDALDSDVAFYDEIMNVNMRNTYLFTREVVPSMIERSRGLVL